jgi:2,3-bisphosphoglycerate-dependent phosphoglycerate mutase
LPRLILLRHGQSLWNRERRFTGWTDIDLSPQGVKEARHAGRLMRGAGIAIDLAYTSLLKRALRTLWIVLDEMGLVGVPVIQSWRLNERSYGSFEGLCLDEAEEIYGAEQVRVWRKSFHHRFPARPEGGIGLQEGGHRRTNPIAGPPSSSESLKEVQERLLPLWQEEIAADLEEGRSILVVSHGNTIRALVKHIEGISDLDIEDLAVHNADPLVYELDGRLWPAERIVLGNNDM